MDRGLVPSAYLEVVRADGLSNWPALSFWSAVEDLVADLGSSGVTSQARAIRDAFVLGFVESIARITRPAMTSELIERGCPWELVESAWSVLSDGRLSQELRNAHPVLISRVDRLRVIFCTSALQLISRINDPQARARGELTHVRILGDMHARGAVCLLYMNSEPELVYKPRSLALDEIFRKVLERVGLSIAPTMAPRHPRSFDRGDYGFQEYIRYSSPDEESEQTAFYEQFGVLVAVSYALRAGDLHRENIRSTVTGPVVLDAECVLSFHPDSLAESGSRVSHPLYEPRTTVLDSGLLPNWRTTFDAAGPRDTSALGSYGHADRLPVERRVVIEHGNAKYVYERVNHAGAMPHQPKTPFGEFPADPHRKAIRRGFDAAYDAVMDPAVQRSILRIIESWPDARTRLVPADTVAYDALLQASREPAVEPVVASGTLSGALRRGARHAIDNGVVPLFERRLNDGAVVFEDGSILPTPDSPIQQLRAHFSTLSPGDREDQGDALILSLDLGAHNPSDGRPIIALPRIDDLASRIGEEVGQLIRSLRGADSFPWTVMSRELKGSHFSVSSARPGLYSGVSGLAFGLGIAGNENSTARTAYNTIRTQLLESVEDDLDQRVQDNQGQAISLTGSGFLGPLLSIASVAEVQGDAEILGVVADLGSRIQVLPEAHTSTDLMSGDAGIAIGFARLAELTGEPAYHRLAERAVRRLTDALPGMIEQGVLHVGLAHGLSGIAVALESAAGPIDERGLRETACLCIDLEDHLIASGQGDARGSGWTWCWGATGQLTARLICDIDSPRTGELELAVQGVKTLERGICHGISGPALLVGSAHYQDRFSSRNVASTKTLPESIARGVEAPPFAIDVSLYTGVAGVLVHLCTVRDDANFSIHDLRYVPCEN